MLKTVSKWQTKICMANITFYVFIELVGKCLWQFLAHDFAVVAFIHAAHDAASHSLSKIITFWLFLPPRPNFSVLSVLALRKWLTIMNRPKQYKKCIYVVHYMVNTLRKLLMTFHIKQEKRPDPLDIRLIYIFRNGIICTFFPIPTHKHIYKYMHTCYMSIIQHSIIIIRW